MKKILFLLLLLSNLLSASYLLDKDSPLCIESYYVYNNRLYYVSSEDNETYNTREDQAASHILIGYEWDSDNEVCKPKNWLILGMDVKEWHFLEALTGVLFGFTFMIFTIYLFVSVGKEK